MRYIKHFSDEGDLVYLIAKNDHGEIVYIRNGVSKDMFPILDYKAGDYVVYKTLGTLKWAIFLSDYEK